jgi:uncharacterized membrane protein YfcA
MWEQYRKTAAFTQIFVLAVCAAMRYFVNMPWPAVAALFVAMQFGALLGTWWGVRMRGRATSDEDDLPLKRRR